MSAPNGAGLRERFERHVRAKWRGAAVDGWRPLGGGRSATTVRVAIRTEREKLDCVIHLEPATGPLAGISGARRQFELLTALDPTPVAAPRARWLCEDSSVLGDPFYVSDFMPGDVPSPWGSAGRQLLAEQPPGGPLARGFLRELVAIHSVDVNALPASAGGGDPAAGRTYADRERRRWSAVLRASQSFADDPLLAYADAWLAARRPAAAPPALVHGDYRMGNLVVDGADVVGVLDWELAEVGDPVADLGTICSPPLRTGGLACGLWEPESLVAAYERERGMSVDRDALAHHRVLATFKVACLWVNASGAFAAGEPDLASLRAGFSALETRPMLAEVLGLPDVSPPRDSSSPSGRAAAALRDALRDDVLPHVSDDPARERLSSVLAILGAQRRASSAADDPGTLDAAVAALASAGRRELGESAVGGGQAGSPARRLAQLVRTIMADAKLATDQSNPLHAQLRATVALASATEHGRWP